MKERGYNVFMKCLQCGKRELVGRQAKWCSRRCEKDNWKSRNIDKHRSYIKKVQHTVYERRRELLKKLKSNPCTDCKVTYPWYVMEFDHCRGIKLRHISLTRSFASDKELLDEVAKCDLVCANCHRQRTWDKHWSPKSMR